jgi:hypothetical protein
LHAQKFGWPNVPHTAIALAVLLLLGCLSGSVQKLTTSPFISEQEAIAIAVKLSAQGEFRLEGSKEPPRNIRARLLPDSLTSPDCMQYQEPPIAAWCIGMDGHWLAGGIAISPTGTILTEVTHLTVTLDARTGQLMSIDSTK